MSILAEGGPRCRIRPFLEPGRSTRAMAFLARWRDRQAFRSLMEEFAVRKNRGPERSRSAAPLPCWHEYRRYRGNGSGLELAAFVFALQSSRGSRIEKSRP